MTAFLGIDAGNTGVKAVLFDDAGRELARAHRDTGGTSPTPGQVERDIGRLRHDLDALIVEVLEKAGVAGSGVAGIGAAGHGNGLYLLGRNAAPLAAVQSLDTRAADLVAEWEKDGTSDGAAEISMQRPWPSQTPALLAWFARNRPEIVANAGHVVLCKDVVTHALTGEIVSDVSDMGGAGLLRLPENRHDDALMDAYGLGAHKRLLPPLLWPTDVAGRVTREVAARTGLAAGTPVAAGFFDVVASAAGAGVTSVGEASVIIGTWSINQAIVAAPNPHVFMSCGVAPGRFMAMENSATSAANLEWLAHNLLAHDSRAAGSGAFALADALAADVPLRSDGPLYHPYLYGASGDAAARAGFFGLAGWHDAGDLVRALYEGVAFAHLAHVEKLREAGVEMATITLSGGGVRSPLWPQMLADALGVPLRVAAQPEAGALGAAMAASVAAGRYADLDSAAAAMVAPALEILPDPDRTATYRQRFALWQDVEKSLAPHWTALRALGGA